MGLEEENQEKSQEGFYEIGGRPYVERVADKRSHAATSRPSIPAAAKDLPKAAAANAATATAIAAASSPHRFYLKKNGKRAYSNPPPLALRPMSL